MAGKGVFELSRASVTLSTMGFNFIIILKTDFGHHSHFGSFNARDRSIYIPYTGACSVFVFFLEPDESAPGADRVCVCNVRQI